MKYAEVDLRREYARWQESAGWGGTQAGFALRIRKMVTNPQVVDERLRWCQRCGSPHDLVLDNGKERTWCPDCWRLVVQCGHCGEHSMDAVTVTNGMRVCRQCLDDYYVYCRQCSLAYPHGQARLHLHGADGCCDSPAKEFTIPLQGGAVANDVVVPVQFEVGQITARAIRDVVAHLSQKAQNIGGIYEPGSRAKKMYDLAVALNRNTNLVGREVTTREGNFTTRLKRHAYKEFSLKIEPETLTHIGNLVSTQTRGQAYNIAFTRELNLPPAEFGNQGSCWWTDYKESRCALKNNGGMAMRDLRGEKVLGRAWVMPLKVGVDGNLAPTFDTHSGIYFAFNGYGTLAEEYHRVLAEMMGAETTVGVQFEAERYYVNSGAGKLIGPADIVKPWAKKVVAIPLTAHSDLFQIESAQGLAQPNKKENAHV